MTQFPETHAYEVKQVTALIDPDNPKQAQVSFLTELAWMHFRLSRTQLEFLSRVIRQELQAAGRQ